MTLRRGHARPWRLSLLAGLLALVLPAGGPAPAAEPESCRTVTFSDVGWTDITATTAVASVVLRALGYEPRSALLSVPVTYASLKTGDVDVFLGNWMPSMAADREPYLTDGSVVDLGPNLTGAKYTLAVPRYVAEGGLTDFSQIAGFRDRLDGKIYGIEPGNDGNRLIQTMIDGNRFALKGFELVESSEQAMLAQLARAERRREWMVFLGWEPHPMNSNHDMVYLSGGDEVFGPDFGGATVHTNVARAWADRCPNAARLMDNLVFSLAMENEIMGAILDEGVEPGKAAQAWLTANPGTALAWLDGVTTLEGGDAAAAVTRALAR